MTIFSGMLGKAEKELTGRKDRLKEQEAKALDTTYDAKNNQDAADGKKRLTTDDKKYK